MSTKLAAVSFPRLGAHRELKNLVEGYWLGRVSKETLMTGSRQLRETQWSMQREAGHIQHMVIEREIIAGNIVNARLPLHTPLGFP